MPGTKIPGFGLNRLWLKGDSNIGTKNPGMGTSTRILDLGLDRHWLGHQGLEPKCQDLSTTFVDLGLSVGDSSSSVKDSSSSAGNPDMAFVDPSLSDGDLNMGIRIPH